ncbi:MAG: oligosaccharide flippase family protein [Halobacteriota archaeon]
MGKYTLPVRRLGLTAIVSPLASLSSLILLPILTKNLPIDDYGAWALIMVTTGLVPTLVTLGLPNAMIRFLAAATDKRDIQEGFYSMGFVVLLTSSIVSGLFFLFAREIAANLFQNNTTIALLLVPIILLSCLNLYALQYFVTLQQIKRYSVLNIFSAYLSTALIAYAVLLGHGLEGAVIALLIVVLVLFAVVMYLIVAQIGFAIPKFRHTRQHLAFGLPLVPGALSQWIVNSSDRYLIALFLGAAAVGYYSPGYSIGSAIAMLYAPLTLLLPPLLSKNFDENNIADVRTILTYSLKWYAGIALPCVFALSVLSKPLLLVLTTQQIAANGYLVTPLVAAGTALTGAYAVLVTIIALKKRTAIIGTIWILSAALNFGLNVVLIPYLGLVGAALTTFLAFLLAFVLTTVYSFRYFAFDVNKGFIVKSVCGSSIIALFLLLWNPSGLLSILVSIALAAVIYVSLLLALRGFTIQELKLIYGIYKGNS